MINRCDMGKSRLRSQICDLLRALNFTACGDYLRKNVPECMTAQWPVVKRLEPFDPFAFPCTVKHLIPFFCFQFPDIFCRKQALVDQIEYFFIDGIDGITFPIYFILFIHPVSFFSC